MQCAGNYVARLCTTALNMWYAVPGEINIDNESSKTSTKLTVEVRLPTAYHWQNLSRTTKTLSSSRSFSTSLP